MNATALLDAGAIVPLGSTVDKDDTVDAATARTYRHPVLGDRAVVRLVPGMLGPAEDLAMDFLGLQPDPAVAAAEVGLIRQQALGFPSWALVHDPANGHHALALVKEMEKLARGALTKIGPARDGFTALGERLARTVPHFLPTFYEEAGRAFIAADSPAYAASMFGRGREAEQMFNLAIDEERLHLVFLEFALAGALTAKALSGHSRTLAARTGSAEAYERFRRLCVERVLGGLPPYATMPADLRRLAKAAKLDPVAADDAVVRELLQAPATVRAPDSFWSGYRASIARLAAAEPRLCGVLLGMFPENCGDEAWLAILADSGADVALFAPADAVPAEQAAPDGPAGWLHRFAKRREARYNSRRHRLAALQDLVTRMADRLIADGVPVRIAGHSWDVDLDLIDTCLAAGIPVADLPGSIRVGIGHWFGDTEDGRRDLAAIAADPRFLPELADGVCRHLRGSDADTVRELLGQVIAVPGLRQAAHAALARVADELGAQGLPFLDGELDTAALFASPDGAAVHPDAVRRLLALPVPALLGRTLRSGLLAEYGWPALDEAVARLATASTRRDTELRFVDQWPYAVLRRGDAVLVAGPERLELEHLSQVPAGHQDYWWTYALRYVDGQLLVSWDGGASRTNYWTGAPDDVFVTPDDAFRPRGGGSLPLPGGGRTGGGRPFRAGDRSEDLRDGVVSDGVTYWRRDEVDGTAVLREYDPSTGADGRVSLPSFFEDAPPSAGRPDIEESWLTPVPPALAGSPLGVAGDLAGWRCDDGERSGRRIDGRTFTRSGDRGRLRGALTFPGSPALFGVVLRDSRNVIVDADGFALGSYPTHEPEEGGLPLPYWHHLRPRDPAGSAALRQVDDELAAALLAAVADLPAVADAAAMNAAAVAAVGPLLPEVTDPALLAGITESVRVAATARRRLSGFAELIDGQQPTAAELAVRAATAARPGSDTVLHAALGGLIPYCYSRGHSALDAVAALGRAVAGEADEVPLDHLDVDWFDALGALPRVLVRALGPVLPADQREALVALLETVVAAGLLTGRARLRKVDLTADAALTYQPGRLLTLGDRRLLILDTDADDRTASALEYAPTGTLGSIAGHRITDEKPLIDGALTPERITAALELLRANGPVPWRPELVDVLSTRAGMSRAEAAVLLLGVPADGNWNTDEAITWREGLGLSEAAVKLAVRRMAEAGHHPGSVLLDALVPTDLATLWTAGVSVDGLADWWIGRHGGGTPVSDELIVSVDKARAARPMHPSTLLHGIANPTTCRWLAGAETGSFTDVVVGLARAVPWLAYHLPPDSPLREQLPTVVERVRALLADPATVVYLGYLEPRQVAGLAKALATTAVEEPGGRRIGPVLVKPDSGWHEVMLSTAVLTGPDDPLLRVLQTRLADEDEDEDEGGVFAALRALLSPHLPELVTYRLPDPAAGPPQDPSRSVPELVAEVARTHNLSTDAATLYLQLLALPDPTDRKVAEWTGWKPARLKRARAELAGTDLVVAAKRTRAGRGLFLPGGWLALGAPHLPLERWKLPLLVGGVSAVSVVGLVLPVMPPPALFDLAWERVRTGDIPRFDELVTERRR